MRYEIGKKYAVWTYIPLEPESGSLTVGILTSITGYGGYILTYGSNMDCTVSGTDVCALCPIEDISRAVEGGGQ